MTKTLIVQNISKSYGKRNIIRDVSISISQGEVVGLLGPNGAGKTTSFYMIVGLVRVDSGKILINNNDITKLSINERAKLGIGYLPQESSIFRGLSVEDNIMAVLEINEPNLIKRNDKLEKLLDEFSIKHIRKSSALALSGGERRRTEIARALATEPNFMLLDEPFAGVDPIAINDIRQMVIKLAKKGVGILITDHNVRETLSIVDKAYIVHDGKILFSGSSKEITDNKNVKSVYLGDNFSY